MLSLFVADVIIEDVILFGVIMVTVLAPFFPVFTNAVFFNKKN